MVIIVRNTGTIEEAVMTFTNSEWLDAINMQHGAGIGYTVADTVMNTYNILGISSSIDSYTGTTSNDRINPLTHSEVAALAIGSSFTIAS